jgi:6-phosphogluconolactonase/glucosamine-6-phosphate isomerase/deaminase
LPVINNARNVITIVLGANKAEIFQKIINEKNQLPASKIDVMNGQMVYLLDKEAAQRLPYHESYSHEGAAILYEPIN